MQNYGGFKPTGLKDAKPEPVTLDLREVQHIDIGAGVFFPGAAPYRWTCPDGARALRVRYDEREKRLVIEAA
jgi:hypothetical protein